MSNSGHTSLGQYIAELIDALSRAQPGAFQRMRQVVGNRRSRIVLDDERIDVWFEGGRLRVQPADGSSTVAGVGATDSSTVLALLDGVIEVADAILDGYLRVTGSAADISRMFIAIEILLDASARVPELERLADRFRSERSDRRAFIPPGSGRAPWYPFRGGIREEALLQELGLIPEK